MIEIFYTRLYNHDRFHLQFIHVHIDEQLDNSESNLANYSNIFNHPRTFWFFMQQHNTPPPKHDC